MGANFFYGVRRRPRATPPGQGQDPIDPPSQVATGRISRMLVGHGQGQIRLADGRAIFFHRADLREGTTFNGLHIGDVVAFELLDDPVSGPRALRVGRRRR